VFAQGVRLQVEAMNISVAPRFSSSTCRPLGILIDGRWSLRYFRYCLMAEGSPLIVIMDLPSITSTFKLHSAINVHQRSSPLRCSLSLIIAYVSQSSPGFNSSQTSSENVLFLHISHFRRPHTSFGFDFSNESYFSRSSDHDNSLQRSQLSLW